MGAASPRAPACRYFATSAVLIAPFVGAAAAAGPLRRLVTRNYTRPLQVHHTLAKDFRRWLRARPERPGPVKEHAAHVLAALTQARAAASAAAAVQTSARSQALQAGCTFSCGLSRRTVHTKRGALARAGGGDPARHQAARPLRRAAEHRAERQSLWQHLLPRPRALRLRRQAQPHAARHALVLHLGARCARGAVCEAGLLHEGAVWHGVVHSTSCRLPLTGIGHASQ